MASAFHRYFIAPGAPRNAGSFIDNSFVVVELSRERGGFGLGASALTRLPEGLVVPSFESENIRDIDELTSALLHAAEAAGLSNRKLWSVALPEAAARTFVITLESKPSNRRELDEILDWKIERLVALPPAELRTTRQRISPLGGQERYLVTVSHEDVVVEYETVFDRAGWRVGLLLPRHLSEAQWLLVDGQPGDKMLVSSNRSGFTAVIVRNGEPVLVRSFACEPGATADEMHRFALYYRDRLGESSGAPLYLAGVLVLGPSHLSEALSAVGDALDTHPHAFDPSELGFNPHGAGVSFDQLAAAAGLASMSWR